jgi:hypothetical protein
MIAQSTELMMQIGRFLRQPGAVEVIAILDAGLDTM